MPSLIDRILEGREIQQRRPWPNYGQMQSINGVVNSNYHALTAKLNQRLARGLNSLVSFTWSKAIDDGSAKRVAREIWERLCAVSPKGRP